MVISVFTFGVVLHHASNRGPRPGPGLIEGRVRVSLELIRVDPGETHAEREGMQERACQRAS